MTTLDLAVMAGYFVAVAAIGALFTRRQRDASDYFLGELPWWAVMLSIVATETSALSVISVPGLATRGDLTFLQLPMGYLVGRVAVAVWLLPGYFEGQQETAYTRLERRFGPATRRIASGIFMLIRALGDSVRVFATAIPLAIVTGWDTAISIAVVASASLVYTWSGGLKAVVWVDVLQLGIYLIGGLAVIGVAASLAGGFEVGLANAAAAGKLRVFDWTPSFAISYTFYGGFLGGALLSAATHGTDHLFVQRLLATRDLPAARKALVGSGVVVIVQFAIFLLAGTFLWAAGGDRAELRSDDVFPTFVVNSLPPGLAGLVVAGLLAAAMSTVSSSLNSLASATTHDLYAPLSGRREPRHLLTVGRWATIAWAIVLAGGALAFRGGETPVVELALSIASITYGSLLGTYVLGGLVPRARQPDAVLGIAVACAVMVVVVLAQPGPLARLAWPWYVPMGTAITVGVAAFAALVRRGESS